MGIKNFTLVTGFLFLGMGLLHVTRIIYGWSAMIAGWSLPMWASGVGAFLAFFLCFEAFLISRKSR